MISPIQASSVIQNIKVFLFVILNAYIYTYINIYVYISKED